jgi:ABC-type transporter Mla subunit MlaD
MSKFLLYCFLVLCLYSSCKSKPQLYYLLVNDSHHITEDAIVRYKGFPVGRVKEIRLHNDSVLISLQVEKEFNIPRNADIILEGGLLQTNYLNVLPTGSKTSISPGDTVRKEILLSDQLTDSAQRQQQIQLVRSIVRGFVSLSDSSRKDSVK